MFLSLLQNDNLLIAVKDFIIISHKVKEKKNENLLSIKQNLLVVFTFLYKKTIFCLSLNFVNIMLEIRVRFSYFFPKFYVFVFFNCLFNRFNTKRRWYQH